MDQGNTNGDNGNQSGRQMTQAIGIEKPNEADCVFGRGKRFQNHPGNRNLHRIVNDHLAEFVACNHDGKNLIIAKIVRIVQDGAESVPAGRFLKRREAQMNGCGKIVTLWDEVTDAEARIKVGHTFRSRTRTPKPRSGMSRNGTENGTGTETGPSVVVGRSSPTRATVQQTVTALVTPSRDGTTRSGLAVAGRKQHDVRPHLPNMGGAIRGPTSTTMSNIIEQSLLAAQIQDLHRHRLQMEEERRLRHRLQLQRSLDAELILLADALLSNGQNAVSGLSAPMRLPVAQSSSMGLPVAQSSSMLPASLSSFPPQSAGVLPSSLLDLSFIRNGNW